MYYFELIVITIMVLTIWHGGRYIFDKFNKEAKDGE